MALVVLTGGTGLIGSHVAEALAAQGVPLRAVVRSGSDTTLLEQLGAQLVCGDVTDEESLERAFAGATFVIHTAGMVTDWGAAQDFHEVNVRGTQKVMRAAFKAQIRDVIVTGSCSSYGEEHCENPKNERALFAPRYPYFCDSWFRSGMNHYRCSKAEATKVAMAEAAENDINLTVLEPVFVFGEREFHSGFYSYLEEARRGTPMLPGHPDNLFHVVYARDLARAYILAFQQRLSGVNRLLIGNPQSGNMDNFYSLLCNAAGFKKPRRVPKWSLYPVGFVMEAAYAMARSKTPPVLTRGRVNMFYDTICYDVSLAEKLLGFRASTPLEEAISNTVAWYRANGYL